MSIHIHAHEHTTHVDKQECIANGKACNKERQIGNFKRKDGGNKPVTKRELGYVHVAITEPAGKPVRRKKEKQ